MLKQIMIPVAAFSITVSSAAAFSAANWSELDIGLTDTQVSALEEAHEIRQTAHDAAEQVLTDAGIDEEKMREIKNSMHAAHDVEREAMRAAIENNDYGAFVTAIADSPLADSIDSQADFDKFVEAHELMKSGDRENAQTIFTELGIDKFGGKGEGRGFGGPGHISDRQSVEAE